MNKLLVVLCASAFALGSLAAMADDDKNQAAYSMGMASQREHDLRLQEAQGMINPATPESKAIEEAAMKARAAYPRMTPEEKAAYKKGMRDQKEKDDRIAEKEPAKEPSWTVEDAHRRDNELSTAKPKPIPSR